MIGPLDTLTLARTKIRSKRLRLFLTTLVSALVFGVLAGATILLDGMSTSLAKFAEVNLDGQYLVAGGPNFNASPQYFFDPFDPAVMAEVEALNTAYLAERKEAAKKYGITDYDPRSEIPAFIDDPAAPPEFRRQINADSVAYRRWAAANAAANPPAAADAAAFTALVEPLGATKVYETRNLGHLQLAYLVGGQEDLTAGNTTSATPAEPTPEQQTAIASGQYTMVPDELVASFITPAPSGQGPVGVPALVSADDAVTVFGKTLGLERRPTDTAAQIQWFTTVRDAVRGSTFAACYRNDAERARIEQTRSQLAEIAANKNNADYVAPPIRYALPTTPCGLVTVTADTRTQWQKDQDANRAAFEATFNPPQEPRAELVQFEVVGLLPSSSLDSSGVEAVLNSIVGVNYGFGVVIAQTSWAALPAELKHESLLTMPVSAEKGGLWSAMSPDQNPYIAAFPSVSDAKNAVDTYGCQMSWTPACETAPIAMMPYGTNYLAVDQITTQTRPVLLGIFAIAFTVATIIIWAMMGRVIADSRRETAVFRAIGARRSDIASVYLTYSLWVALRIVLVAAVIALAIAGVIEFLYAKSATQAAQLSYAVFTPEPTFSFLGFSSPALWWIFGGIIVMSLVAITPPLLRNIRRNPIKDMRDD